MIIKAWEKYYIYIYINYVLGGENKERKLASLQLYVPHLVGSGFKCRLVRCASERQELFNRIAHVFDNLNDLLSFGQH